jgi:hypothetical protein
MTAPAGSAAGRGHAELGDDEIDWNVVWLDR